MYLVTINENNLVLNATSKQLAVKFFEFSEDRKWSYSCWNLKIFVLVSHKILQRAKSRKNMNEKTWKMDMEEGRKIRFKVRRPLFKIPNRVRDNCNLDSYILSEKEVWHLLTNLRLV